MILLAFIGGVLVLVLLLHTICGLIDRCDYVERLKKDKADLLAEKQGLKYDLQVATKRAEQLNTKLQNQVCARRWAISSEAERRCTELELELHQLQKKIEIKDAMLRAMLPAEKGGK